MKNVLVVILMIILVGIAYFVIFNEFYKKDTINNSNITQIGKNEVIIKDNEFNPYEMIIKKGTSVLFINNDPITHTVTGDNGSFNSGQIELNQNYRHTFNDTGVFQYHCSIHPNMVGQIIVRNEL